MARGQFPWSVRSLRANNIDVGDAPRRVTGEDPPPPPPRSCLRANPTPELGGYRGRPEEAPGA